MASEGLSPAALDKCQTFPSSRSLADRNLLCRIRAHLKTETEELGCPEQGPDEQRYIIYKDVFDKVIDNATAYKNILTSIKKEYEETINILHKGREDSLFLQRKLKSMASEPMTLMAYKKRASQLQNKLELIKQNTAGLEAQLQAVKNSRNVKCEPAEETLPPQDEVSHIKSIPGLTLKESINVDDLCKHLRKLEKKLNDLRFAKETKYVPVEIKTELIQDINRQMQQWDELVMLNKELKLRYKRLKLVADAVAAWGHSGKKVSLTKFILPSLTEANSLEEVDSLWPELFDDNDPGKINESAYLLEYVERFHKLFNDKQYKAAAMHVANCPRGILNNLEVMERFKDDYLFLLSKCPSTELIQCLTHEWNGNPAVFSTGIAVLWLISNDHKEVGFHLLKEVYDSGQGALEQIILNDTHCTLEDWQDIADACNIQNYNALADSIFTVLTSQEGGTVITITTDDDNDGARLTEHVLL
ncbi:clathrin heavy chain linker domain-containing protein 1-like isoform X6 [Mustelus asterias]